MAGTEFWDAGLETMPRERLEDIQLLRLNETLQRAWRSPFYRTRLSRRGLKPYADSLADIRKFPFTTKDDLRDSYPDAMVCVPREELVRMHASSGTTGRQILVFHTNNDLEAWTDLVARSLYMVGVRRSDIFQNMMSYGLFTGGLGLHYGAERIGCLILPTGTGNTERQIGFLRELGTTVAHITPSYCLHLAFVAEQLGVDPEKDLRLRTVVVGAEPHSEATRRKIERLLNVKAYNCYGLSEMNGPGVAFECPFQNGLHIWEDAFLAETIDPETGEPVPEGAEGELVLTTLRREGMPILRYRTRDLTCIVRGGCACGRTHRRIERIKGRSDDMFIVKGVNIFPSQIETVLMETPEVDRNYRIILDRAEGLDTMIVEVELKREFFTGDVAALRKIQEGIADRLRSVILVSPAVELVEPGTIPPSTGKAQRVVDRRKL